MIERYGLNLKICEDLVKDDNATSGTNSPRPCSPNVQFSSPSSNNQSNCKDRDANDNIDIQINDCGTYCDNSINVRRPSESGTNTSESQSCIAINSNNNSGGGSVGKIISV